MDIPIEQRAGPVRVGEFVTAWCESFQIRSFPPQQYAEYVITEELPMELRGVIPPLTD